MNAKDIIQLLEYGKKILPQKPFEAKHVPELYIELLKIARQLEDFHRNDFIYDMFDREKRFSHQLSSKEVFIDITRGLNSMQAFRFPFYTNIEIYYNNALQRGTISNKEYEQYVDIYHRLLKMVSETDGQNLEPIPFPFHHYNYTPGSYEDKLHKLNKFMINILDTLNTLYKMEEQVIIQDFETCDFWIFYHRCNLISKLYNLYKKIGEGYIRGEDQYELLSKLNEKYQKIQMKIQRFRW